MRIDPQATPVAQNHLYLRGAGRRRTGLRSTRGHLRKFNRQEHWPSIPRQEPLLLQLGPPRIDLLPLQIMKPRNLANRRAANADRLQNRQLLLVAPPTPPLNAKNFASH